MRTFEGWRAEMLRITQRHGYISTFELESNRALALAFTDLVEEGEIVCLPSEYPIIKIVVKGESTNGS